VKILAAYCCAMPELAPSQEDNNDNVLNARAMFQSGGALNSENHYGKTTELNQADLAKASVGKLKANPLWHKGEGLEQSSGVDPNMW